MYVLLFLVILVLIVVAIVQAAKGDHSDKPITKIPPTLPYRSKQYFFNRSELEFFRILNSHLDAHRYTVFPKVRLADLVKVNGGNKGNWGSWNKIKSKHIDYVIWDLQESRVVLAVELDGKSHNGSAMSKSDAFKDEVFQVVGLQLERVKVGSSFEEESDRIKNLLS